MDTRTVNVLSICSGVGGIELGLHAALDGRTRTICYVENELSVASILAARMEDGSLDSAVIWTDLRTFDPAPWRGKVDLLAGGFPCQPHSVAGSQLGEDDPRELSGEVLRIADGLGLPDLFLENVPGILRFYWDSIRPQLREMGYRVAEGLFTASETGAPHRRERLFILAQSTSEGLQEGEPSSLGGSPTAQSRRRDQPTTKSMYSSPQELADTDGSRHVHEQFGVEPGQRGLDAQRDSAESGNELADTAGTGSQEPRRICGRDELRAEKSAGMDRRFEHQGRELADTGCDVDDSEHYGLLGPEESGSTGLRTRFGQTGEIEPEQPTRSGGGARGNHELAELPLFPPGPNDHAGWEWLLARWPGLAPTYCKDGHDVQPEVPATECEFCGSPDGPTQELPTDALLRGIGNGVIPIVVATAYLQLTKQLEERKTNDNKTQAESSEAEAADILPDRR